MAVLSYWPRLRNSVFFAENWYKFSVSQYGKQWRVSFCDKVDSGCGKRLFYTYVHGQEYYISIILKKSI